MGELKDKKIIQARTWLDPSSTPIPEWDYEFTYPITTFEAVLKTWESGSTNLIDEFNAVDAKIAMKQNKIPAGDSNNLMTYAPTAGNIGAIPKTTSIATSTFRSHYRIPTEKAVGDALDTKASLSDFTYHFSDTSIHITQAERNIWNYMTPISTFNLHTNDKGIHITNSERLRWDAKADNSDFVNHINDTNNPHKVTASQVGTYTRKQIDDKILSVQTKFFNYLNIVWDERVNEVALVPYNPSNWSPNFLLDYNPPFMPDVPDANLIYFALMPATNYLTNETDDVIIFIKQPSMVWQEIGRQKLSRGDLFVRYPDSRLFLWLGHFVEILTR